MGKLRAAEINGQTSAAVSRPIHSDEEIKISRKLPFIPVTLRNGITIKALVDTNTSNSSVNPKVLGDMMDEDVKFESVDKTIYTRVGEDIRVKETAELTLSVANNPSVQHNFDVVDFPTADMILGYDFVKNKKAVLNFERGSLSLKIGNVQAEVEEGSKTDFVTAEENIFRGPVDNDLSKNTGNIVDEEEGSMVTPVMGEKTTPRDCIGKDAECQTEGLEESLRIEEKEKVEERYTDGKTDRLMQDAQSQTVNEEESLLLEKQASQNEREEMSTQECLQEEIIEHSQEEHVTKDALGQTEKLWAPELEGEETTTTKHVVEEALKPLSKEKEELTPLPETMDKNKENRQNTLTNFLYWVLSFIVLFIEVIFWTEIKTEPTDEKYGFPNCAHKQEKVTASRDKETATRYPSWLGKNFKYRRKLIWDTQPQYTKSE